MVHAPGAISNGARDLNTGQKVLICTDMISNLRLINLDLGYRPEFCKQLSSCILRVDFAIWTNREAPLRLAPDTHRVDLRMYILIWLIFSR